LSSFALVSGFLLAIFIYLYLDFLKSGNAISNEFTSAKLSGWNFGSWQNIEEILGNFKKAYYYNTRWIWPLFGINFLLTISLLRNKKFDKLVYPLIFFITPLVFPHLFGHNYYHVLLMIPLSFTVYYLINDKQTSNWLFIFALLFAFYSPIFKLSHSNMSIYDTVIDERNKISYQINLSNFLNKNLDINESYFISGVGYSPVISYLSKRKGLYIYDLMIKNVGFKELIKLSGVDNPRYYVNCGDDSIYSYINSAYKLSPIDQLDDFGNCSIYKVIK